MMSFLNVKPVIIDYMKKRALHRAEIGVAHAQQSYQLSCRVHQIIDLNLLK